VPSARRDPETGGLTFHRLGLAAAGLFYLAAIIHVLFLGKGRGALDPDVTELVLAHWQLEDGYREGFEEMIRLFEEMKREQGARVKVVQTTVPWRGYRQWMMTQLISSNPADVLEIQGSASVRYQYFTPLSPYAGKPNPFNAGTPLEGMAWKDTFLDGMEGAFDRVYAEYFGVGNFFHNSRLHVNVDLVEKATGTRALPTDLTEWMETCRKIEEYAERIGEPISPIGVRGFDRGTLNMLFRTYYSQLNGHLNDDLSRFCDGEAAPVDILRGLKDGTVDRERLSAVSGIVQEIGQHFVKGFTAVDLEQSKYLFYTGKVAFFPEGSWNSYSLVKNCPFEVAIIRIPPVGHKHRYSKYFTGKITESGVRIWGAFGIPKACRNFDLALELLQFMTSYEINQMTMDYCKWPPAVKKAKFEGILKAFQPDLEGNLNVAHPFYVGWRSTSHRKISEALEEIIMERAADPGRRLLEKFAEQKDVIVEELEEAVVSYQRTGLELEAQRSQMAMGLLRGDLGPAERRRLALRGTLAREAFAEGVKGNLLNRLHLKEMRNF